jgi:hypothetical protein
MLAIEFKYGSKGEIPTASTRVKLQQLLRDSHILLTALSLLYPQKSFMDVLDDIMDIILPYLKDSNVSCLFADILSVINCILLDRNYLLQLYPGHIQAILQFIQICFQSTIPAALESECSKAILPLARFYYELNEVVILKELMIFALTVLARDDQAMDTLVCLNFSKALSVCLRALGESHPVYCRFILKSFIPLLERSKFKRPIIIDKVLNILAISIPFSTPDPALSSLIAHFLCSETVYNKLKIYSRDPVQIVNQKNRDKALHSFLSGIAAFCNCPELQSLKSPKNGLDIQLVIVYAKALGESSLSTNWAVSRLGILLPKCAAQEVCWILVILGILAKNSEMPPNITEFALQCLERPPLHDSASFYLKNLITSHGHHFSDIINRMSHVVDISSASVELLRLNFLSRYSEITWSKSAYEYYSSALDIVDRCMDGETDLRQASGKLLNLLPPITALIIEPLKHCSDRQNFKGRAIVTTNKLAALVNAIGSEGLQQYLCSKWNDHSITALQGRKLFELPLQLITQFIQPSKMLLFNYENSADSNQRYFAASWLWSIAKYLTVDGDTFNRLHLIEVVAICLRAFHSSDDAFNTKDFFASKRTPQQILAYNRQNLELLIEIYNRLGELKEKDDELRIIIEDCGLFIMERLQELPFTSEDLVDICRNLPELPLELAKCANKLVKERIGRSEIHPLLELAIILKKKTNGMDLKILNELVDICKSGAIPLNARVKAVQLGRLFKVTPKFIERELVVAVLQGADPTTYSMEDMSDDIDNVAGSLWRLARSSKCHQDMFAGIGRCLSRIISQEDGLFEIRAQLDQILPSDRHKLAAASYIQCSLDLRIQVMLLPEAIRQSESYWFWLCCKSQDIEAHIIQSSPQTVATSYAPVISKTLLAHFSSQKSELVKSVKNILGAQTFEHDFKANFFRIIAYFSLFCHELRIADDVVQRCIAHVCETVKIKPSDIFESIYGEILVLELVDICRFDLALQKSFVKSFENFLGNIPAIHEPVETCLLHHLETMAGCGQLLGLIREKVTPNGCDNSPKAIPGVRSGLASTLSDQVGNSTTTTTALACLKKVVELVNCGENTNLPEKLKYALLSNGQRTLLKSTSSIHHKIAIHPEPNDALNLLPRLVKLCPKSIIGKAHDVLLCDEKVLKACSRWIFAQALIENSSENLPLIFANLSWTSPPELLLALSEAIKTIQQLDIPLPSGILLPPNSNANLTPDAPEQWLFLLEQCMVTTENCYATVYSPRFDSDYAEYFRSLSNSLSLEPRNNGSLIDANILNSIEKSMLLNQKWDCDDINETFDPYTDSDKLYLQLRNCVLSEPAAKSFPILQDGPLKLSITAAQALVDPSKRMNFAKEALDTWMQCRASDQIDFKLATLKTIEASAKTIGEHNLQVLAEFSKADFLWKYGNKDQSLRLLSNTSQKHNDSTTLPELSTRLLLKTAKYAWATRSKPANQIRRDLLEKIAIKDMPLGLCSKAFHALAKFYDEQFQRCSATDLLSSRKKLLTNTQRELDAIGHFLARATPKDATTYERNRTQLQQQVKQDTIEIERIMTDREQYALKAAANYLKAISSGEKYDLTVFRLCSLWFAYRKSTQMNNLMSNGNIPVHKLIPLMYQLAARAECLDSPDIFQEPLQGILLKILISHPHHSLYQMLALRAAGNSPTGSKRKLVISGSKQERRAAAAGQLISKARSTSKILNQLFCDTEKLWLAYTEMALVQLPQDTSTTISHPYEINWAIRRVSNLCCPVPTKTIPVDPSEKYSDLVTVSKFSNEGYRVIGGINLPKIVECQGSDGLRYRQLVKGRDDVRQVKRSSQSSSQHLGCSNGASLYTCK